MKTLKGICFAVILLGITSCSNGSNGILSSWVQMGPSGSVMARVITTRVQCPDIKLDNLRVQMSFRSEPDEDFPVLVCEIEIPPETAAARIGGRELNLPRENITRLVVIGDAGCRLEDGDTPQSCNDPAAWPFERVAQSAARLEPELVIHVGDYLYREDQCPDGDAGCEGSPFGDNFLAWNADFFDPAQRLLRAAPWVFSRGNHEECSRAGPGWFTFLDPNPPFPECEEFTPAYTIDIGPVELLMLDSASAKDNSAPSDLVDEYSEQIAELESTVSENAWFVTHHPLWGIGESDGEVFMINETLQASTDNMLAAGINLVLTGHIHFFEILDFDGERPPQLIVGNSGTELDDAVSSSLAGMEIGGDTVSSGVSLSEFGFVLMELKGDVWEMSLRDVDGEEILMCEIEGPQATCFP